MEFITKQRLLGTHCLSVSEIGCGCMGMKHGYEPPVRREGVIQLMRQGFGRGVTFLDAAEIDSPLTNDEFVGGGMKPFGDQVEIGTTFGIG